MSAGPGCRFWIMLLFLTMVFVHSPAAQGAQVVRVDADVQFGYAESLYAKKDYLLAVSEYKRFIFLFPRHRNVETAMYRVGMCYFLAGRFAESITSFKDLAAGFPEGEYADPSYFRISEGYVRSNKAGAAITNLHNLVIITGDPEVRDEAYYRMGWLYVEMAEWTRARKAFDKISERSRNKYRLKELSKVLANEQPIKRKNPGLAGALAIIPGAGYLYCGRYQDALIALLVNGGLIWAAYESFSNELYALGGVITFIEIGFYAGNIYGSVASAHKYNRKQERRWIDHLMKNVKVGLASRRENKGLELSFKYIF